MKLLQQLLLLLVMVVIVNSSNRREIYPKRGNLKTFIYENIAVEREEIVANVKLENIVAHAREIGSVTRVAGSDSHSKACDYIVGYMKQLSEFGNVNVVKDEFVDVTPKGKRNFTNIIVDFIPSSSSSSSSSLIDVHSSGSSSSNIKPNENDRPRLVLAAHYDSKWFPEPNKFFGASDSAVPVAILMEIARAFLSISSLPLYERKGLSFIFFDGEEAFEEWSSNDSLYGSRHLASLMEKDKTLNRIGLLLLLDLCCVRSSPFPYLPQSDKERYKKLYELEEYYNNNSNSNSDNAGPSQKEGKKRLKRKNSLFSINERRQFGYIEDDHTPFLHKGVNVLHLIGVPFPSQWHNERDTLDNIDFQMALDVATILTLFVNEDNLIKA